jgi:DNA-binding transcriptional ArsR family regulator
MDTFKDKSDLLSVMGNAQRLRALTILSKGEMSVGPLAERLQISQSALSQHLAKLRSSNLVQTRRDAQTVFYSVKSPNVAAVLSMLESLFSDDNTMRQRQGG